MRVFFGRKLHNLDELKAFTLKAFENEEKGEIYEVVKEIKLNNIEFTDFVSDFLAYREWISNDDGMTTGGVVNCIKVTGEGFSEVILVNNEGYGYARYTALELPNLIFDKQEI